MEIGKASGFLRIQDSFILSAYLFNFFNSWLLIIQKMIYLKVDIGVAIDIEEESCLLTI